MQERKTKGFESRDKRMGMGGYLMVIQEARQQIQQIRQSLAQRAAQIRDIRSAESPSQMLLRTRSREQALASYAQSKQLEEAKQQALQEVQQAQQQVTAEEQRLETYVQSDAGKLQYAKEQGLKGTPVAKKIAPDHTIWGTRYETPYGTVDDYSEAIKREQKTYESQLSKLPEGIRGLTSAGYAPSSNLISKYIYPTAGTTEVGSNPLSSQAVPAVPNANFQTISGQSIYVAPPSPKPNFSAVKPEGMTPEGNLIYTPTIDKAVSIAPEMYKRKLTAFTSEALGNFGTELNRVLGIAGEKSFELFNRKGLRRYEKFESTPEFAKAEEVRLHQEEYDELERRYPGKFYGDYKFEIIDPLKGNKIFEFGREEGTRLRGIIEGTTLGTDRLLTFEEKREEYKRGFRGGGGIVTYGALFQVPGIAEALSLPLVAELATDINEPKKVGEWIVKNPELTLIGGLTLGSYGYRFGKYANEAVVKREPIKIDKNYKSPTYRMQTGEGKQARIGTSESFEASILSKEGSRAVVNTRVRDFFNLDPKYQGIYYQDPEGYAWALAKLQKQGLTLSQAKSIIAIDNAIYQERFVSSRELKLWNEALQTNKIGAKLTTEVRQPRVLINEDLGIYTRGAKTKIVTSEFRGNEITKGNVLGIKSGQTGEIAVGKIQEYTMWKTNEGYNYVPEAKVGKNIRVYELESASARPQDIYIKFRSGGITYEFPYTEYTNAKVSREIFPEKTPWYLEVGKVRVAKLSPNKVDLDQFNYIFDERFSKGIEITKLPKVEKDLPYFSKELSSGEKRFSNTEIKDFLKKDIKISEVSTNEFFPKDTGVTTEVITESAYYGDPAYSQLDRVIVNAPGGSYAPVTVLKPGTVKAFEIPQTDFKTLQNIGLAVGLETAMKADLKIIEEQLPIQKTDLALGEEIALTEDLGLGTDLGQPVISKSFVAQLPEVIQQNIQRQQITPSLVQITRTTQGTEQPPIRPTFARIPPFDKDTKKRKRKKKIGFADFEDAFDVEVRRRGKFVKVYKGLPKGEALFRGSERVRRTLEATFRVVPSKLKTTRADKYAGFVPSRKIFGKPKKPVGGKFGGFVQRRGQRLSSRSEVRSIQASRRKNKALFGRFGL